MSQGTVIKNIDNIETKGRLRIGMTYIGFTHKNDMTLLNVKGKLIIDGNVSINRGCRIDIGENAIVKIGSDSYINSFTNLIIMHGLEIGKSCAISWKCQFLDEDFHHLHYPDKKNIENNAIVVSDHVWIGANVSILKGTFIAKCCVVASNSVVKGVFPEENVLIAGNPAKIIKTDITWG